MADGSGSTKKGAAGKSSHGERKKPQSRSVRAGLVFPVGRIGRYLKKGRYAERVGRGAPVYLAAVLEYLIVEVVELAGNVAKTKKRKRITPRDFVLGLDGDEELSQLFKGVTIADGGVVPGIHPSLLSKRKRKPKKEVDDTVQPAEPPPSS